MVSVGVDIVEVNRIERAIAHFGARFLGETNDWNDQTHEAGEEESVFCTSHR